MDNGFQIGQAQGPRHFDIRLHPDRGKHYLYLDAGKDPSDGAPLTWAREATAAEVFLFELGDYAAIARILEGEAPPSLEALRQQHRPGAFKRLLRRLFGRSHE